jgi:MinD superfamily P-loop ATPase
VKELVVISGKGGTGKTSMVASFAALAGGAVLADCDVDAADLHLLLEPTVLKTEPFMGGRVAKIRPDACTGCGACEEHCRFGAILPSESTSGVSYAVDPIACEGCGVCVWICPEKAIEFPERQSGEWFVSTTRHGPMVHARLGVAESNSGKLVTQVRTKARDVAEAEGLELVIVDGPPGIGCPVIASVAGASLILVVTEPTLSGVHDLKRVVNLANHFQIPAAVCVNKHDINPEIAASIEEFCREEDVWLAGRVPYDPRVTKAQIEGLSMVETQDGPTSEGIRQCWSHIVKRLDLGSSRVRVSGGKGKHE